MNIAVLGLLSGSADPYWQEIEKGVKNAAKKYNLSVEYLSPSISGIAGSAESSIAQWQGKILEELIRKGIKGIALPPLNPVLLSNSIKKAKDSGIPIITYDVDAPETERYFYVGTNNYLAGKIAGNTLSSAISFQGEVVIDTPTLTAYSCTERIKGFKEALERFNKIKIVGTVCGEENPNIIATLPNKTLMTYSNLVGIFAAAGVSGGANARAVKLNNKQNQIKIVCFDATPEVINFIREGIISACIAQRPYVMGTRIVEFLHRMITQGIDSVLKSIPATKIIDTGVDVVNKDNLPDYQKSLRG